MGLAELTVIFIGLIAILSALRLKLVYELSGTSLLLFHTSRPGIVLYSVLVLPGTIIHELSHWLVAEILQVRTGEINILPRLKGGSGEERLGSVATAKTDPIRGFLIGVAPFITGLAILTVLGQLLFVGWSAPYPWWQLGLIIYGIMVIGNSMLISRSDRHTWPFMILLIILIIIALIRSDVTFSLATTQFLAHTLSSLNLVLGVTTLLNLFMIGGSYTLRRMIEKITKRRIIHK